MPNVESIDILGDGYVTVRGDGLPARHKLITTVDYAPSFTAGFTATNPSTITLTGKTTSHIGLTSTQTANVAYTGWSLGFFGTTTLSATTGNTYNAAGGVFEVNFASAYAANQAGLVCGAYVGAYSSSTNGAAKPTTALWIETIPGTGVDFTNVPLISFVTSGAGTKSAVLFELGNNSAGKTVSTVDGADTAMLRTGGNAASNIQFKQGIQVVVNNSKYYIPLIAITDWQDD